MASITINIPDDQVNRVVNAMANRHNYASQKLENETKAQFAKRIVIRFIMNNVEASEAMVASQSAVESVNSEVTLS